MLNATSGLGVAHVRATDTPATSENGDGATRRTAPRAALGPLEELRRTARGAQPSEANPRRTEVRAAVSLFGFASDLTLDGPLGSFDPPHPYRITGHVGYSLDDGRTIFGFGPSIAEDIAAGEMVMRLGLEETFPGMVTDDTGVFREVAGMPRHPVSRAPKPQIVYKQDIPMSREQFDAISAEHDARPLGEPMPEIRYGFPFPNSPAFNCATYPGTLGIPIPHPRGVLEKYIPKLAEKAARWRPDE